MAQSQGIRGSGNVTLSYKEVKQAARHLRAANHGLRQRMLELIGQKGSVTVTDLYKRLRLEQSVASQHLAILREAGYVKRKRDGKWLHYSVNKDRVAQVARLVKQLNKA